MCIETKKENTAVFWYRLEKRECVFYLTEKTSDIGIYGWFGNGPI